MEQSEVDRQINELLNQSNPSVTVVRSLAYNLEINLAEDDDELIVIEILIKEVETPDGECDEYTELVCCDSRVLYDRRLDATSPGFLHVFNSTEHQILNAVTRAMPGDIGLANSFNVRRKFLEKSNGLQK